MYVVYSIPPSTQQGKPHFLKNISIWPERGDSLGLSYHTAGRARTCPDVPGVPALVYVVCGAPGTRENAWKNRKAQSWTVFALIFRNMGIPPSPRLGWWDTLMGYPWSVPLLGGIAYRCHAAHTILCCVCRHIRSATPIRSPLYIWLSD